MKTERIYRELLLRSLAGASRVKQEELVGRCQVSLGLVNKTIKKLETARAAEATRQGVRILSPARILNLWSTERKLSSNIIRAFRLDPVEDAERKLPRTSILTAFSAWYALIRNTAGRLPSSAGGLYSPGAFFSRKTGYGLITTSAFGVRPNHWGMASFARATAASE